MDPNANLKEQRELAKKILEENNREDVDRLAELVLALDEWLSKGGFPPTDWVHG